jgi:threonine/homoserine/homoserine lactone efflux protein
MIVALFVGLIIGFISCIPIGPLQLVAIDTLIKKGFNSAFAIGVGSSVMDFVYFIIVLTGTSLIQLSPKISLIIKIVVVVCIFAFGIKLLMMNKQQVKVEKKVKSNKKTLIGFFMLGVLIYFSNPTLIVSMSAMAITIKSWNIFNNNMINYLSLSIGFAIGSALWFYVLLKIVKKYENKIPDKIYANSITISGIFVIISSIYMGFKVYKECLTIFF